MAKVYFITALILGQALVFVDGQTSYSMSMSSNSNAPTSSSSSSMSTRSTTSTANGMTPTSSSITLPSTTVTTSSSTSTTATTSTSSGVPTTTTTSTTSGVPTTTTTSTTSGASTSAITSTPSGVPTTTTTSTPSGVPTTTTTSTPSGVSTTATTSTPSSVTTPMTTSVSASLSTTSTNSISSSLSTTTTTTTTSTSSRTSTTTTTSASSSMAPPIPGTMVIICLYVRLPSCNSNEHGNVSSPQTQALFGNVSTNLRNIYKEGQTEFIGLLDLQSSACSSNIYVVFYIKVTFIRGIFPSGVTIVNVFTTNIADGLLGNLPVSSTQYNITFQGVTITRSVKDGECQSVCCGAGGPITFVEQCTSGVCEGFQGKETMEAGHCDGGANDACKNVDCDKDGSGASSRYAPSFALLMLVTAASFLKLRV